MALYCTQNPKIRVTVIYNLLLSILLSLLSLLLLTTCLPATATQPILGTGTQTSVPTDTPEPNTTTPVPNTATLVPTKKPAATKRSSRTPKPSPTLPYVDEMNCIPRDSERVSGVVGRVIDGDTVQVLVSLLTFTVRYIGLDTPETNQAPAERLGPEATVRNRELVGGKRVTLVADPETGNTDRYGRLLRFVIIDDTFVNYQLVREGFSHYSSFPNACGSTFFRTDQDARHDKVGLWAPTETP